MNKKSGFTLAEVLITLGIIGVVAAMTIPTLIANTNSAKFKTGFKKDVSTLSQAALMAQAQYDVNFSGLVGGAEGSDTTDRLSEGDLSLTALFNNTLAGVTISDEPPSRTYPELYNDAYYAHLADGSMIVYSPGLSACARGDNSGADVTGRNCVVFIDVNGVAGPNKIVGTGGTSTNGIVWNQLPKSTSVVPNNATYMTDIYPVTLYDAAVVPATGYAKYVLTSK